MVTSGDHFMSIENSIVIDASKEKIWDILTDVKNWKQWDNEIKFSGIRGPFSEGTKGTLISIDEVQRNFRITSIKQYTEYCNEYTYPCLTKLKFTRRIEPNGTTCKVIFAADFTGLLGWYFTGKENRAINKIMQNALENLKQICQRAGSNTTNHNDNNN